MVSLGIRSREQVTCYSTSPTRIPDYRRQHHRSDGLRSFFKRFSTSLRRRLAHTTSRDCSPVSATTATIPENRLARREWERESRVIDLTVAIYVNERELDDMGLRKNATRKRAASPYKGNFNG